MSLGQVWSWDRIHFTYLLYSGFIMALQWLIMYSREGKQKEGRRFPSFS